METPSPLDTRTLKFAGGLALGAGIAWALSTFYRKSNRENPADQIVTRCQRAALELENRLRNLTPIARS